MSVVDRIERSPLWWVGRLLIPSAVRLKACVRRGEHHPQLVDLGRTKVCGRCGAW